MAGVSFNMRYTTGQQDFVRRTLTLLQILGRHRGLIVHYRGHRALQYYNVQIDGPLATMQMLEAELIPYLSGAVLIGGALTKRERVRIGSQLVIALSDAIEYVTDQIHDVAVNLNGWPSSWRFACSDADVSASLRALTNLLFTWQIGLEESAVSSRVMVETWHTAFETVLKWVYGRTSTFVELVKRAEQEGRITEAQVDVLKTLNKRRVAVKHQGQGVRRAWLETQTNDLAEIMHRLLR